ncbi:hypothetical protein [Nostoc sp.]|uniref:hypothetical protein n=1 Tax=Nostoc sp. TaxID=1180 RepID=UPI0035936AF1
MVINSSALLPSCNFAPFSYSCGSMERWLESWLLPLGTLSGVFPCHIELSTSSASLPLASSAH